MARFSRKYLQESCPRFYGDFKASMYFHRPGSLAQQVLDFLNSKGFAITLSSNENSKGYSAFMIIEYKGYRKDLGTYRSKEALTIRKKWIDPLLTHYEQWKVFGNEQVRDTDPQ